MQPSRMFNQGAMQTADLLREVSAMRLAEQVNHPARPRVRRFASIGSLAFAVANWRRLSARHLFPGREDVAASPSQASGA